MEGYAKLFLKNSRAMMAVMVSGKVCRGLRWPVWSVRQVLRLAIARSTGARSVLMALLYCFWEGYATTLGMLFRLRDPPKSTAGDRARERSGRSTPKNP